MPDVANTLPVSINEIGLSLLVGLFLGLVLRYHFMYFGSSLVNRRDIGDILPFIVLIIILVISIVKSSLALSLGLVGALSIVRFRTPIKEPEELAYLFMAIAIGLGLGAGQVPATIVATVIILLSMAIFSKFHKDQKSQNLYLSLQWKKKEKADDVKEISNLISKTVDSCDIRRVDSSNGMMHLIYYVNIKSVDEANDMIKMLESKYSDINISLIDQNRIPNV